MKKFLTFCLMFIIGIFGMIGCDCGEEETLEAKFLRLYDLNQNKEIDNWEKPFSYDTYNGVEYISRAYHDRNGKTISVNDIHTIDKSENLNSLNNLSISNMVIEFLGNTYFERNTEHKIACYGARAYIVHIQSVNQLKEFAKQNLTQVDNDKYILVLDNDISFRTGDSKGDPIKVFDSTEMINLNGASLYGCGHTIEGFLLTPNSTTDLYTNQKETPNKEKYDTPTNTGVVNLKYSLISNANAVYDINIYLGYNNISINPYRGTETPEYSMVVDVAPLRNIGVIDNVVSRGKIDINTSVLKTTFSDNNSNKIITKSNISMLTVGEDASASAIDSNTIGELERTSQCPFNKEQVVVENAIYDYDQIIETTRKDEPIYEENVPEGEIPQIIGHNYIFTSSYKGKITTTSINNVRVEGEISYTENLVQNPTQDSAGNEIKEYYDACEILNIGGIYTNALNAYNETTNCTSDMVVNLETGASIFLGGIMSDMSKNAFAENTKSKLATTIKAVKEGVSVVGGVVGHISELAEVKNCVADLNCEYSVYKNPIVKPEDYMGTNISVGGIAGLNKGMIIFCDATSDITTSDGKVVSVGSVAGSSINGIFIKNLSTSKNIINNAGHAYTGTVVGSCVGGMISTCIAESTVQVNGYSNREDAKATKPFNNQDVNSAKFLTRAYRVNNGLLYFQSQHFYNLFANKTGIYEENSDFALKADSIFDAGDICLGAEYSPKCINNLVIDNTDVNFELKALDPETDDRGDVIETTEVYLGKYINIGGYYLYRFLTQPYHFETINVYTNLKYYNSSYKLNGSKELVYKVEQVTADSNTQTGNKTEIKIETIKDLYSESLSNKLSAVSQFNMAYLTNTVGYNGIDRNGMKELVTTNTESIKVSDLDLNNIYPGKYLSPDDFVDLSMDKDLYADLIVDTYDELIYLIDIFMNKNSSLDNIYNTSLLRKDLFNVLLFNSRMFSSDGYKTLTIADNNNSSEYKYQRVDGKFLTKNIFLESALNEICFGEKDNKIYAFKKSALSNTKEGDETIYHLPEGFEALEDDVKNQLTPMEIILLYRVTQIIGVKYVEFEINANRIKDNEVDQYSKLLITLYYHNYDDRSTTYALDTLLQDVQESEKNNCENYNVTYIFFEIKSVT